MRAKPLLLAFLISGALGFAKRPKNPISVKYDRYRDMTSISVQSRLPDDGGHRVMKRLAYLESHRVTVDAFYVCPGRQQHCRPESITLGFMVICASFEPYINCESLPNRHDLILLAGGQKFIYVGQYDWVAEGVSRSVTFNIGLEDFKRIANSPEVEGTIGLGKPCNLDDKTLLALRTLAEESADQRRN